MFPSSLCCSCDPEFFQSVCSSISVRSTEEAQQLEALLQLLGFQLLLTGELPRRTCCSVGRVLHLCGSKVDLILTPRKMSVRGAARLFRHTTQLHSLRQELKSGLSCSSNNIHLLSTSNLYFLLFSLFDIQAFHPHVRAPVSVGKKR